MDRFTLSSRLSRIEEEIPKLSNTISAIKITDTGTYGKNYEELSMDAAQRAERIACSLRNLIFAANLIPKPVLMVAVSKEHGITITHSTDRVVITLPGLMPKRTKRINTTFLTDPLHASLDAYTKEHTLPHFTECVVCFSHIFDRNLSARRVRDYDNLECKQLLDTVATFLMTDDSGLFCDAYHTTELGDKNHAPVPHDPWSIIQGTHFPLVPSGYTYQGFDDRQRYGYLI